VPLPQTVVMPRVRYSFRARSILRRVASTLLTAMAFGFGGGLGGLGSGTHRVGKPERDNLVVCIAEHVSERR